MFQMQDNIPGKLHRISLFHENEYMFVFNGDENEKFVNKSELNI